MLIAWLGVENEASTWCCWFIAELEETWGLSLDDADDDDDEFVASSRTIWLVVVVAVAREAAPTSSTIIANGMLMLLPLLVAWQPRRNRCKRLQQLVAWWMALSAQILRLRLLCSFIFFVWYTDEFFLAFSLFFNLLIAAASCRCALIRRFAFLSRFHLASNDSFNLRRRLTF